MALTIKQRCMELAGAAADAGAMQQLQMELMAVIIKLRHVMEQAVHRALVREVKRTKEP